MSESEWAPGADLRATVNQMLALARVSAGRRLRDRLASEVEPHRHAHGAVHDTVLDLQTSATLDSIREFGVHIGTELAELLRSAYGSLPPGAGDWLVRTVSAHVDSYSAVERQSLRIQHASAGASMQPIDHAIARVRLEIVQQLERTVATPLAGSEGVRSAAAEAEPAAPPEAREEARTPVPTTGAGIYYNLTGSRRRVAIAKADAETTVVNVDERELFATLRERAASIGGNDAAILRQSIDDMERDAGTAPFGRRYAAFVQAAVDHGGVFEPFFPALTQLLTEAAPPRPPSREAGSI